MKIYLLFLVLFFSSSSLSLANEVGEIVAISKNGEIKFFSGEYFLIPGEKLRVIDSNGESNRYIEVIAQEFPFTTAVYDSVYIRPGAQIEAIKVGQIVKLEIEQKNLKAISFFVGPNTSPKVGSFGGTNYFLGLSMLGYFKENWLWHINLQAESLGKDSSGTEMRRGIYMFGTGYEWKNFSLIGSIGLVDTMTIIKGQSSPTYIDPYTGVAYGPNGTKHSTKIGYMLLLSHRFYLSQISRTKKIGWSLSPRISYTDQFATSPYKGVLSYGLAIDFWMD